MPSSPATIHNRRAASAAGKRRAIDSKNERKRRELMGFFKRAKNKREIPTITAGIGSLIYINGALFKFTEYRREAGGDGLQPAEIALVSVSTREEFARAKKISGQ